MPHWSCEESQHIQPLDGSFQQMCESLSREGVAEQQSIAEYLRELPYGEFLKTFYWRTIRREVLRLRRFKCVVCRGRAVQLHHIRYDNRGREHLHLGDLRALCESCHRIVHGLSVDPEEMISQDMMLCRMLANAACLVRGVV